MPSQASLRDVLPALLLAGAAFVALVAISVITNTLSGGQIFYVFATFGILAFALVHGAIRYGWPAMLFFLALVTVVSWSYESLRGRTH